MAESEDKGRIESLVWKAWGSMSEWWQGFVVCVVIPFLFLFGSASIAFGVVLWMANVSD